MKPLTFARLVTAAVAAVGAWWVTRPIPPLDAYTSAAPPEAAVPPDVPEQEPGS